MEIICDALTSGQGMCFGNLNPSRVGLIDIEMEVQYGVVLVALWNSFTKHLCNFFNYMEVTKILNWVQKHNFCYFTRSCSLSYFTKGRHTM